MRIWECTVCGLVYDEALGWPEDDIAPGTRWEDVPEDWMCPDCGVGKDDFVLMESPDSQEETESSSNEDSTAPIVIIGTGLAGYGLAKEFRKLDKDTPLLLITRDGGESYSKPMLSTGFTKGVTAGHLVQNEPEGMASLLNAKVLTSTYVESIDTTNRTIHLESESQESRNYSKLVLALGSNVINPPIKGDALESVFSINDLDDYGKFRDAVEYANARKICVIGAGLIGCEYTNDLINGGFNIEVVDALSTCLPTLLPDAAGKAIQKELEAKGVKFHFNTLVETVNRLGDQVSLSLSDGTTLQADLVVSAVGVRSNIGLATDAELKTNRGICTDRSLQTSDEHIYAIGDCAEVDGHVLVYVAPLMAQARALAMTLTGNPTPVIYPAMPVTVKVPACPTVVAPPAQHAIGEWEISADGTNIKAEFKDKSGSILGFALTGSCVTEKQRLQALLPPVLS